MLLKNVAGQGVYLYAYNVTSGAPDTGDAANITGYYVLDNGTPTAFATANPTEVSSTHMPGVYWQPLSQAGTNGNAAAYAWTSTTSGVQIGPILVFTTGVNLPTAAPTASNGLVTVGAGSGQLTPTNGGVNVTQFGGQAIVLDANNYPSVNIVDVAGQAASYYTGTAQGGTVNTITLASGDTSNPLFRQISLVGGTGAGQVAICTAYNASTKVATVSCPQGSAGDWATNPDSTTLYAIDQLSPVVDGSGNAHILGPIKQNTQLSHFPFYLVLSADHVTGATGMTVTATRNIYDGNGFVTCDNSPTEDGNGWYNITLAASDLNAPSVALRLTAPGCDPVNINLVTTP